MKLKVYSNDWFFNLGIVGFIKILEKADKKDQVTIKNNYIEFDSSLLDGFQDDYFAYFLDEYNVAKRIEKSVKNDLSYLKKKPEYTKDIAKRIKERFKKQADKVKKYNPEIHRDMAPILTEITKVKKKEDLERLVELSNKFLELLSIESVNEKLTLNLYKFIVGDNFFGQVSFFNVNKAKADLKELKEIMFKDYLRGILETGKLNELIQENDLKKIEEYMDEQLKDNILPKNIEKLYKKIKREYFKKKNNTKDFQDYINGNSFINCSMCGQYKSSFNEYTESYFAPLAVSSTNSRNMFWNHSTEYPMCDICKFILFCTPAGTTQIYKSYLESDDKTYYGFVNMDTCIKDLLSTNKIFNSKKDRDNPFDELILDLVTENREKSIWQLQNILFVEFKASVGGKSCKMNYFNMPKPTAKFFKDKGSTVLSKIYNYKFKAAIVDSILKSNDIKLLINSELREKISTGRLGGYDSYLATKARYFLNMFRKGVEDMNDKKLKVIYYSGRELHDYYKVTNAENKIISIGYKLLNAAKSRNKKDFMDTVLRVYMTSGKSVPTIFLDVMAEKDLDFETIAHAFVSGLISEKYENTNENKEVKANE